MLGVLNKFNLVVTALWMSNCVLQTMSDILFPTTFTGSCAVRHLHHQVVNSVQYESTLGFSLTFWVTTSQVKHEELM